MPAPASSRFDPFLLPLLWVLMASAMLVESDAYRYATLALVALSMIRFRNHVRVLSRDWLAWFCWLWAAYAAIRFVIGVTVHDARGTSEWLYIFPLFFPALGVALYKTRQHLFPAAIVLIAAGGLGLLASIDWAALGSGERVFPLFHNNPIHAAIGCGMLLVTSIFLMLYVVETRRYDGWRLAAILGMGFLTVLLSGVGILGAQSKGVWLALGPLAGFMSLAVLAFYGRRLALAVLAVLLVAMMGIIIAQEDARRVAGPTIEATSELFSFGMGYVDPRDAMRRAVENPDTPASMRERLMLWTNALDTVESSPWFGWGNLWQDRWRQGTYQDTNHRLLHNGYLEILVRHGLFGALVLAIFILASAYRIYEARRQGIISASLMLYLYSLSLFFFITIATNSNNRLALGESYFLLAGAAVFAISLAMRISQAKPADVAQAD
ncbi:O-antigen ligase domain-containing protein [Pseudorhizobium halotolerans]|uniref:O-antigen ligase domain-containing protein n=1 Tax=Pseudorhizobium halotolerans TaxID=1233081 RepID=A0ABN7JQ41_9HYPH|nr:O-antigen ligase family protein [Pseudorhizobium halotolerans]CAD7041885.1 O-antigen ligase domain-containing protein [Pseudorhizobium halotolerans]